MSTPTPAPEPEIKFDTNNIKEKITYATDIINKLKKESKSDSEIEAFFFNEDEQFYQKYPFLIKKLIKADNMEFLNKMIDNLVQVEAGQQTFASTELKLGTELADKYLPKMDK